MCLGDSVTYGQGRPDSYPVQLEKYLNQHQSQGETFQVVNAGIPGANSSFLLGKLADFMGENPPQVVVAMMGINDSSTVKALPSGVSRQESWRMPKLFTLFWRWGKNNRAEETEKIWQEDQDSSAFLKKISKLYAKEIPVGKITSLPTTPQVLENLARANHAFEHFEDEKLKTILIQDLQENVLNFPFLYMIESREKLARDPEIDLFLRSLWGKAKVNQPDFWNLWFYLADKRPKKEALAELTALIESHQEQRPNACVLGHFLAQHGYFSVAGEIYQKNHQCWESHFEFLLGSLKFTEALEKIGELPQARPDLLARQSFFYGKLYYLQGQTDLAIAQLKKDASPLAMKWLAFSYAQKKDFAQALSLAKQVREGNNREPELESFIAEMLIHLKKEKEAESFYLHVLELAPFLHTSYMDLAHLYLKQGQGKKLAALLWQGEKVVGEGRIYLLKMLEDYYQKLSPSAELTQVQQLIKAEEEARVLRLPTEKNYQELFKLLSQKNIALVVLPYARQDSTLLRSSFQTQGSALPGFISHQDFFRQKVEELGGAAIFADMFAGDTGHLTPQGAGLMAQVVGDYLLKERPWKRRH